MLKLIIPILLTLSFSAWGQMGAVQQRIVEAFNKRAADDLLIGGSIGYIDQSGQTEINLGIVDSSHQKFAIGSISKSFTGIVLAQLILENKIKLNSPLEDVLPELRGTYSGSVTIQLLANHKARFLRDHPDGYQVTELDIINFLKTYRPGADEPAEGEKQYSNLGFTTLGIVISRITGKSFSDAVRERIFFPLGMTESGFLKSQEERDSLITPHNTILQPTSADSLSEIFSSTGGITSSLHDMMKFLNFNYSQDAAVRLAQKERLGFDHNPGEIYVWKNGSLTGFSSIIAIDVVNKKGTIVLLNSSSLSSVERLALVALGVNDTYKSDTKIPFEFSKMVTGKYFNEKFNFYMDVVTTPKGFLGFLLSKKPKGDNVWGTRLVTDDLQKFFLIGNAWSTKDFIVFRVNSETGLPEVILNEFHKSDSNGKPIYIESIFEK